MSELVRVWGTVLAFLAIVAVFALSAPNFLNPINLLNIVKQASYLGLLAIGFTVALVAGELDLSVGQVATLASIVCAALLFGGHAVPLAVLAGLAAAGLFGVANGLAVTRFRIPSLIATLATGIIASGTSFMITGGVAYVGKLPASFLFIGRGALWLVPMPIVWLILATACVWVLLAQTRLGSALLASGEAPSAARLAGIDVGRTKLVGLALSGLLAGCTGILLTSSLASSSPTIAVDFLMKGIAAVLLGMTTISPGRPNLGGTLVGVLLIIVLGNGLTLLGAPYYAQDILLGVIMLLSVSVSAARLSEAAFGGAR